jgi:protein kinase A
MFFKGWSKKPKNKRPLPSMVRVGARGSLAPTIYGGSATDYLPMDRATGNVDTEAYLAHMGANPVEQLLELDQEPEELEYLVVAKARAEAAAAAKARAEARDPRNIKKAKLAKAKAAKANKGKKAKKVGPEDEEEEKEPKQLVPYQVKTIQPLKLLGKDQTFGKCQFCIGSDGQGVCVKIHSKRKLLSDRRRMDLAKKELHYMKRLFYEFDTPCRFLRQMIGHCQDYDKCYIVMNHCHGADMYEHLSKHQFFPEDTVKYYTVQVLLGLEHLHSLRLVYNNVRLESIYLNKFGHACLSNFYFIEELDAQSDPRVQDKNNLSYTMYGSPEYCAPEIIQRSGHNQMVDMWALGVLIYEMIVGNSPFYDDSPFKIYNRINENKPPWPKSMSKRAKNVISGLLKTNPAHRFKTGAVVRKQDWWKKFVWEEITDESVRGPIVPSVRSDTDTKMYKEVPDLESLVMEDELESLEEEQQAEFGDWGEDWMEIQDPEEDLLAPEEVNKRVQDKRDNNKVMAIKVGEKIEEASLIKEALEKEAEKQELARKKAELFAKEKDRELKEAMESNQSDRVEELEAEKLKLYKFSHRRGSVAGKSIVMVEQQEEMIQQLRQDLKQYTKIPVPDKSWVDPFFVMDDKKKKVDKGKKKKDKTKKGGGG